MKLVGQYKIKGRVLILPVEGAGDCDLSMENVFIKVNFTGEGVERNGRQYVTISKPVVVLKTKKYDFFSFSFKKLITFCYTD